MPTVEEIRGIRKKLFQAFNPDEPLMVGDDRYVDFSRVRGAEHLLDNMAETIRLSDKPVTLLLTGLSGSGKTTELQRLKEMLGRKLPIVDQPEYVVVYCDAFDSLDVADVDAIDVVMAIMIAVYKAAKEKGTVVLPPRLFDFFTEIKDLLFSEVKVKDIEWDAVFAKVKTEIQTNPNNRLLLRNLLRTSGDTFRTAVNEFITQANEKFIAQDSGGLVVIFDNLEKIVPMPVSGRGTAQDVLFIDGSWYLDDLACHKIYTVSPALALSKGGALSTLYGGRDIAFLPMIPVFTRNGDRDETGIEKLIEAIRKRVERARTEMYGDAPAAFDSEDTVRKLCLASGGYLRGLMSLIRSCLLVSKDSLPIDASHVEDVVTKQYRTSKLLILDQSHVPLLQKINRVPFLERDEAHRGFLDNHLVFMYFDEKGPWFDVNPILRTDILGM